MSPFAYGFGNWRKNFQCLSSINSSNSKRNNENKMMKNEQKQLVNNRNILNL